MQVVSRGTIDEAVEEFERLRRDCSIVPCGTIASCGTGFVGQPTVGVKGSAILVWRLEASRLKLEALFHVEHKQLALDSAWARVILASGDVAERNEKIPRFSRDC
jgi:hypothetical protein